MTSGKFKVPKIVYAAKRAVLSFSRPTAMMLDVSDPDFLSMLFDDTRL